MHSLEPEIVDLPPPVIAAERRDVFSIHAELRFLAWAGVMLIAAGVGVLVSKHYKEIGPLALATIIALAAAACYAYAWWKRSRQASLIDDYILLLGSLLVSADLGFLEHEYHLLGEHWARHFLLLALVHGVVAYLFDSRVVLSLSIAALAAWLGIERNMHALESADTDTGLRALLCAVLVLVWRFIDRRFRANRSFEPVFDHFAANLAFLGGIILAIDDVSPGFGLFITIVLAALSVFLGFRRRSEPFVIYAWIYGTIALNAYLLRRAEDITLEAAIVLTTSVVAIVALIVTHARFRAEAQS